MLRFSWSFNFVKKLTIQNICSAALLCCDKRVGITMAEVSEHITAEQLAALSVGEKSYELIDGELRMMSPAGARHGRIAARLLRKLGNFVEEQQLGETFAAETGFILSRDPGYGACSGRCFRKPISDS